MLRPRWLALLAFSLLVAGVLAWLGQWQLGRAVDTAPPEPGRTEIVQPLADVALPGEYLSRFNDGVEGYWVTGQLRLDEVTTPTSIAVALGWTRDAASAERAVEALNAQVADDPDAVVSVTGRLISDEGPGRPAAGADPQEMTRMSPAMLLGRWHDVDGVAVYRPYLASQTAIGPLDAIDSPAPEERSRVNWLNIFYAAEWAIFAGFALYLWYRLARDAWEKEVEDLEDERSEALAAGTPESRD